LATEGRGSCSAGFDCLDVNESVRAGDFNDFRELSRHILEDLIKCRYSTRLLLCIQASADLGLDLRQKSISQQSASNGGELIKIANVQTYVFKVFINDCPLHDEIALTLSKSWFKTL
jgi:hypothetical protein